MACVAFAVMGRSPLFQAPVMSKGATCSPFSSEPTRIVGERPLKIVGANNKTLCFFKERPDLSLGDRLVQRIDSDGFFGVPCLQKIELESEDKTRRGICSHAVENATDLRSFDIASKMGDFPTLDVQKMDLLDILLGNTDRHAANALVQGDRLIPIDHDAVAMGRIFLDLHSLTSSESLVYGEFMDNGRYFRSFWIQDHANRGVEPFKQIKAPVERQIVNWINNFDFETRAADLLKELDQSEADYIRLHLILLKEIIGKRGHTFAEFVKFQQNGLFEEALRAARDVSPSTEAFRAKFFEEFRKQLQKLLVKPTP